MHPAPVRGGRGPGGARAAARPERGHPAGPLTPGLRGPDPIPEEAVRASGRPRKGRTRRIPRGLAGAGSPAGGGAGTG